MLRIIKGLLQTVAALTIVLVVGLYFFGAQSITEAEAMQFSPSQNLISLSQNAGISLPRQPEINCELIQMTGSGPNAARISRGLAAVSFNSYVKDAQRAEAAAVSYANNGNQRMLKVATQDAIDRWQRALELKAEMSCLDTEIQRSTY